MSSISIRQATAADTPQILACLAAAFAPYRDAYTPDGFADTTLNSKSIAERMQSTTIFVAVERDAVVGTIGCSVTAHGEGHLRGMAVRPERHGAGVARLLLQTAERELARRGVTRITLDTTAPLERAARFYEKCGYRRTGAICDFFGMPLTEYEKILAPIQR